MSKLSPSEKEQMFARIAKREADRAFKMLEDPEFALGGFPLSGNPAEGRTFHVDVGNGKPRCAACECIIFGDEGWVPNKCHLSDDQRHLYPNGDKAPQFGSYSSNQDK